MGGKVSTDFKSSNRIEISRLVQVLLNFDWFQGSLRGGGWVDGGSGWWEGAPHTCAHAHTCMHACSHTYDIIGNSQGFPKNPMEAAICMKLSCLPRMHVCACTWVHLHVCGGHPPTTLHPHPPTPTAAWSPKHQNSISLELIEIIWFCLKILYLWTFLNSYRL